MKKLKTLGILTALSLSANTQAAPVVRIFEIQTDIAQQTRFDQAGEHNLKTSVHNEQGTLAMYAAHKAGDRTQNVVLEIYQDENAYEIHRTSSQYQAYAQMAKEVVKGLQKFETEPQFLAEKLPALEVSASQNSPVHVRLTEVRVKPEHNAAFRRIVIDEMQHSIAKQAGVWVMYAVTLQGKPSEWRFFEIYANEQAYLNYRETAHFKYYLSATEKMVTSQKSTVLNADTLMNKGGLLFNIEQPNP